VQRLDTPRARSSTITAASAQLFISRTTCRFADLIGGLGHDQLFGGADDDQYFSVDGNQELVSHTSGNHVATVDATDLVQGVERKFVQSPVGRLKLTPAAVKARSQLEPLAGRLAVTG
jgi:Ca2+-binding RTX toxin-like protein